MNAAPGRRDAPAWAALSFVLLLTLGLVVIARAWIADDAYISYRVVDNFVHGFGLRWNVADRVQVFTHPLWVLLQIPVFAVTRSPAASMLVTATLCVVASLVVLQRTTAPSPPAFAALAAVPLLVHQRLLDFLWSGLETPLLMLLLAIAASASLRPEGARHARAAALTAAAAGVAITRPDATLLLVPLVAITFLQRPTPRRFGVMLAAGSPALIWSAFAWLYFGSPFPNTALAKLGAPWPQADRWRAGFVYLEDAVRTDPALVAAALGGLWLVARAVRRRTASGPTWLALGAWLHAIWVVRSGGDFMSGRFLLPAYLAWWFAIGCELGGAPWSWRKAGGVALAGVALVGAGLQLAPKMPPVRSEAFWEFAEAHPIDERVYYQRCFSVLNPAHTGAHREPADDILDVDDMVRRAEGGGEAGRLVTTAFAVGWLGYSQGPELHIVDAYGLVDPVIARAPLEPGKPLRPGHLQRVLPDGYVQYLVTGDAAALRPSFAAWAVPQRYVVEAPVFDAARLRWLVRGLPPAE